ncbi:patatin-like phospholipase family protein [Oleisolibacter albus]|uniref:patatin-like phospholipase family protein n=1 Tax=Oleisolibacter albus TaxID=2171757 RepID=UPI000DF47B03|nr:patatin-like phospholipase family protein [Oleisolibacter albus]
MPDRSFPGSGAGPTVALVLGGGNALGAYHGGAASILAQAGVRPDWLVGASIGAVTAAILTGNPPDQGIERLRQFWLEARQHTAPAVADPTGLLRYGYHEAHTLLALLTGRPTIFRHRFPGLWSLWPGMPGDLALYDLGPLRATLERLVDFGRLNSGAVRLTIGCVDLESGDEVYFDSREREIGPEHVLASAAIAPLFPPVEIAGRLHCDPGYANNLPLDVPFAEPLRRDLLCIAVDLFNQRNHRPAALDAVVERSADILFSSHARRSVAALRREFALRQRLDPGGPAATLLYLAHRSPAHQRAGKSLDFSPAAIADRWDAGQRDMLAGLRRLADLPPGPDRFSYLPVTPDPTADPLQVLSPAAPS